MKMTPVDSSNVKAIGYDAATKTLRVTFHSTGTYEFSDVPPKKHEALMASTSKGKHFQTHIRHTHEFTKLDD